MSMSDPKSPVALKGFAPKKWALLYENLSWTLLFRNGWKPDVTCSGTAHLGQDGQG